MLPNIFNFPVVNYQTYFYNFYPNQFYSSYILPDINFNQIEHQNSSVIQESQSTENLKLTLTKQDLEEEGIGISKKHWSEQEDQLLKDYTQLYNFNWTQICNKLPGRNEKMCYSRYRRIQNETKFSWTTKQNKDIKRFFQIDKLSWKSISKYFPNRTAKQIRQHYLNFLRPNIKKQSWTLEEDLKIIELYNEHGKKWKMFQKCFQGRTQNQIKNRFYGRLKRLQSRKVGQKEDQQ